MKEVKKIECKSCEKKSDFKLCGHSPNERYECLNCKAVFIPLKSRIFGKYSLSSPWIERKEWVSCISSKTKTTIPKLNNKKEIEAIA